MLFLVSVPPTECFRSGEVAVSKESTCLQLSMDGPRIHDRSYPVSRSGLNNRGGHSATKVAATVSQFRRDRKGIRLREGGMTSKGSSGYRHSFKVLGS